MASVINGSPPLQCFSEFKGVLPRHYAAKVDSALLVGYTLWRNTMRIIRFYFEKNDFLCFSLVAFQIVV